VIPEFIDLSNKNGIYKPISTSPSCTLQAL
jgi:hypothetical protein